LIDFAEGYLGIYMNTSHFHDELIPYMQGSKVTGFNYEYLTRMIVKYPSVKEQNRIVDFFSNLDTLISNQEKEIITLERLKTTLLKKMFA
jgi:type I restriction enzyme S subunit